MATPLLRSGKLEDFLALGENGQPVYTSALQLRETLRLRQQQNIADCMAVPQSNEGGDRVDWYSPIDGSTVIPWSAASEQERTSALSQLEACHAALIDVSQRMQGSEKVEHQLFGTLLAKSIQFPDNSHVYLVDGKPVLTFWGFVNADKASRSDPLDCLRSPISEKPLPVNHAIPAATAAVAAAPIAPTTRYHWWHWRRFGWLLPLLLLLLLALFLLRGCTTSVGVPAMPSALPAATSSDKTRHVVPQEGMTLNGAVTLPKGRVDGEAVVPVGNLNHGDATLAVPSIDDATNQAVAESTNAGDGVVSPDAAVSADNTTAHNMPTVDDPSIPAPSINDPSPGNSSIKDPLANAKAPLSIPADALASGSTGFLNGNWKAGAGIQDQRTGKPLSLNYQIKNGQGQVSMKRGDGVTCSAGVSALVNSGQLAINNIGQAQCSDGSSYKMPEIVCQPGAQSAAHCKGRYDAKTVFPMTMKRESE
ncbi:SrfA family protein [Rouxiella sp. Mn2063]|uniref:SrfA family protein n=1 Tax=Rouxiella sp. Mn2063 TaxID=3395262 RepID=UPI003BC8A286